MPGTPKMNNQEIVVIDSDDEDQKPAARNQPPRSNNIFLIDLSNDDSPKSNDRLPFRSKKQKCSMEELDRELAERLQREESQQADGATKQSKHNHVADELLAQRLQQQEDCAAKKASPGQELQSMTTSSYGRAVIAVQEIIAFVNKAKTTHPMLARYNVDTVAQDDMVFLAKQMLDKREEFKEKNLPSSVDVGYHYTSQSAMSHIRTNGLLTKADRESRKVASSFHGSVFGDGIYTSENPTAFQDYGDVGLLVGRLKGKTG